MVDGRVLLGLWGFSVVERHRLLGWIAEAQPRAICQIDAAGGAGCDGWLIAGPAAATWPSMAAGPQAALLWIGGRTPPAMDPRHTGAATRGHWLSDDVPPDHRRTLLGGWLYKLGPGRREATTDFSPREREVLRLLALGFSNDAIAQRLAIRASTVKTYLRRVFARTGATNRAHAVALYLAREP